MAPPEFLRMIARLRVRPQDRGKNITESSFQEAVREAQLLLYFASRQGIKIEDTTITKAVEAAYMGAGDTLDIETTKQIEQDFWPAFQQLADAIKPVTIESIKATCDSRSATQEGGWFLFWNMPLAQRSVIKYSGFAVITLLTVIAIQMYWVIGVSVTKETVSLAAEIERLVEAQRLRQEEVSGETGGDARFQELAGEIRQNEQWLVAAHRNLDSWNRAWQAVTGLGGQDVASGNATDPAENIIEKRIAVTSAGFVLEALVIYVIPLLYGLLGAFAYVLREIAKEVRTVTFSEESRIRYRLRLSLGLLAGIAVGFLVSPDTGEGGIQEVRPMLSLTTLGPMALAFMAGYSVELVFAVMDRVVSAFVKT